MTTRFVRFLSRAVLLTLFLPRLGYGQASVAASAKLDESLRESIERGCTGTRSVIITTTPGYLDGLRGSLSAHGDVVTGEFPELHALAAKVHCDDLATLASFGTTRAVSANATVSVDVTTIDSLKVDQAPVSTSLVFGAADRESEGRAATALGASYLETLGVNRVLPPAGSPRIGVAIIDSGIQPGVDFENRITAFYDFTLNDIRASTPNDPYGHGTHVAGLIASKFIGVAPNARLIGLKVLDHRGRGTTDNVVRAIEFAITNRHLLGIHVLNLSLGHPIFEPAATDPLVQAVEHAVRMGLVVVVSAGNFGVNTATGLPGYAGLTSPGNAPSALTTGAARTFGSVTRLDDRIAAFSSRGPSWYDGFAKPNVVAPGDNLLSVAAVGSTLRQAQEIRGNKGNYMRLSGTSMAAGVASGVVTLMLEANGNLTPNATKAVLEYTSIPVTNDAGSLYDALTQGTGQIQASGAVQLAKLINPAAPVGSAWLSATFTPSTDIGGVSYTWSQSIIWGNRRVIGAALLGEQRPAWSVAIVWGEGLGDEDDNIVWGNNFDDDDNIVWGNSFDEDDNIVWGNNIVWGTDDDDNIVWGNSFDDDDNIVWGNNVVWGSGLIGFSFDDDDNIVWGNNIVWGADDDDNIVWGNLDDDNIVWGNLYDDNIVLGNFDDDDNIVWGNSAQLGSATEWSGGVVSAEATNVRARRTRAKDGVR